MVSKEEMLKIIADLNRFFFFVESLGVDLVDVLCDIQNLRGFSQIITTFN